MNHVLCEDLLTLIAAHRFVVHKLLLRFQELLVLLVKLFSQNEHILCLRHVSALLVCELFLKLKHLLLKLSDSLVVLLRKKGRLTCLSRRLHRRLRGGNSQR